MTIAFTHTEFRMNDDVRLLERHGEVASGTHGRVLGRFARAETPTYVVSFQGDGVRVALDVRFEEIVLVDDLRRSAA